LITDHKKLFTLRLMRVRLNGGEADGAGKQSVEADAPLWRQGSPDFFLSRGHSVFVCNEVSLAVAAGKAG
jgi:hypothetical protein